MYLNSTTQIALDENENIKFRIMECIAKCEKLEEIPKVVKEKYVRFSDYKNHINPVLSKCVEMKYSKEMGRGLFATKNIEPGKMLLERDYS